MKTYCLAINGIFIALFAIILAGCGKSKRTIIINPNSGQETESLLVVVNQDFYRSGFYKNGANEEVLTGDISILTSAVEVHRIKMMFSEEVSSARLELRNNDGSSFDQFSSQLTGPSKEHTFMNTNGGVMVALDGLKKRSNFNLFLDLTAFAGKTLKMEIVSINVTSTVNPAITDLSVSNAEKSIQIGEAPSAVVSAVAPITASYPAKGVLDLLAELDLTNTGSKQFLVSEISGKFTNGVTDLGIYDQTDILVFEGIKTSTTWLFKAVNNPSTYVASGSTVRLRVRGNTQSVAGNQVESIIFKVLVYSTSQQLDTNIDGPITTNGSPLSFIRNY